MLGELVKSGEKTSVPLDLVDEALNEMAFLVQVSIAETRLGAVLAGGNHRNGAHGIDEIEQPIGVIATVVPYESIVERLDAITGVGRLTAEIVLAEIGPNVDSWPSAGHLASWACICPGNNQSGGKRRQGKTRKGHKWLVPALVQSAWAASRTKDTYLAAQFHRLRARRGAKRAALAVAHSILTIIYHLLQDPEVVFADLGGDYFLKRNKEQVQRRAVKTLQTLGFEVTLTAVPA